MTLPNREQDEGEERTELRHNAQKQRRQQESQNHYHRHHRGRDWLPLSHFVEEERREVNQYGLLDERRTKQVLQEMWDDLHGNRFFSFIKEINWCYYGDDKAKEQVDSSDEEEDEELPAIHFDSSFDTMKFLKKNKLKITDDVQEIKVRYLVQSFSKEVRKMEEYLAYQERQLELTLANEFGFHPKVLKEKKRSLVKAITPVFTELRRRMEEELRTALTKSRKVRPNKRALSEEANKILWTWFTQHYSHPYPSKEEKLHLAYTADLTLKQIDTWFANHRERYKKRNSARMEKIIKNLKESGVPNKRRRLAE